MAWQDRAYNREDGPSRGGMKFVFPMPSRLTFGLIVVCVVVFFLQRLTSFGDAIERYGALTFEGGKAFIEPWRWITYQYLHAGGQHLFWNLLSIYFLVPMLERLWGWKRTFVFYTLGGVAAGVTFGILGLFTYTPILIGASGCIFAVLGALAVVMPGAQILAMLVIPITMRTLALLYAVLFTFTVIGDRNMSDAAHLGGLVFGFLAARYAGHWFHQPRWTGGEENEYGSNAYEALTAAPKRRSRWAAKRAMKLARAEREERELIDRILAKVSAQGMHSLNWLERRALRKATEHQRQRDSEFEQIRRG
ncbi:MAG TPA: rhomboid family intramembrane serine protease [Tepidisphaeraceae bacterium]|nr:rhomboid family intramembrane serine protease [Tepidisphaeraceae bacterium]